MVLEIPFRRPVISSPRHFIPPIRTAVPFPSTYIPPRHSCASAKVTRMSTITYPPVRRQDFVENLHGVDVADPYRWLEDPKSEDTKVHPQQLFKLI